MELHHHRERVGLEHQATTALVHEHEASVNESVREPRGHFARITESLLLWILAHGISPGFERLQPLGTAQYKYLINTKVGKPDLIAAVWRGDSRRLPR